MPNQRWRSQVALIKLKKKRSRVLISLIFAYSSILALILLLNFADYGKVGITDRLGQLNQQAEEDPATLYLQVTSFDEVRQVGKLRMFIYPSTNYANQFSSSVQTYFRTQLRLDAAHLENTKESLIWNAGEYIRAIDFEIDATNEAFPKYSNDSYFPYDRYSLRSTASLEIQTEGEATETEDDDVWFAPKMRLIPYTSILPGWTINYDFHGEPATAEEQFSNGEVGLEIRIQRSGLHQIITLLLSLMFLISSLGIAYYAIRVQMGKIDPDIEALIWAASSIFALIQTRSVIPNNPRVGVKWDLIVFYPSLALAFVGGAFVFISYIAHFSSKKNEVAD